MEYSKEDLEYLWNEHNALLKDIRNKSSGENLTKKEKILRYKEIVIKLVAASAITIEDKTITQKDVANYCYKKLIDDCGFTYHKSSFYELFEDDFKRNYSQSALTALSNHEHDFELVDILPEIGEIKKCTIEGCNQIVINEKLVKLTSQDSDDDEEENEEDQKTTTEPTVEKPMPRDEIEELLFIRGHNASLISKIWNRSFVTAFSDEKVKDEIAKLLPAYEVPGLLKLEKTILSKLQVYDEQTDKRERLHFAETMRLHMYNELYGLAKCGDILEYSSKWISIVVRQEQSKNLSENEKQERVAELKQHIADCPVCGWGGWAPWYNEQQKRRKKGLDPEIPTLTDEYITSELMQQLKKLESQKQHIVLPQVKHKKPDAKKNIILTNNTKA